MLTDAEMDAYRERERRELALIAEERAKHEAAPSTQHRCKFEFAENSGPCTNSAEGAHSLLWKKTS